MGRIENQSAASGWELQTELLLGVSRTFALTIPQLPGELRNAVGNGYLLCRIADTIEDDPGLDCDAKLGFYQEFLDVLYKRHDASAFAERLSASLTDAISPADHDLITKTAAVVSLMHSLPEKQQRSLSRCVHVMSYGMYEFQRGKSLNGLETIDDMYRYCYAVAGVVGEMLTELFCDHMDALREHKSTMMDLGVCFGLGLQMTNILKDVWEDRVDGSCWLPRAVFNESSDEFNEMFERKQTDRLAQGIDELVGLAHTNLLAALRYSCLIPKSEVGVRKFCLWAIGMALQTLQKIHRTPGYTNGSQVKISRRRVKAVVLSCNSVIYSNRLVGAWFDISSFGLPVAEPDKTCDPDQLRSLALQAMPVGQRLRSGAQQVM